MMKLRQKCAAIIAAAMLVAVVPTFAASTNGVSKFVTVAKDATLEGAVVPNLKIELNDEVKKYETFYLNLENAIWVRDIVAELGDNENFIFTRASNTQLEVRAKRDIPASKVAHIIPLYTKITGGEARVEVDANDTPLTTGKYPFAVSEDTKGKITVGDIKAFAVTGDIASITIEEPYIGAFKSKQDQTIRLQINSRGIELNHTKGDILKDALVGKKVYRDKKFSATVINQTTLEVEIPANSLNASQRGEFELTGIQVKAVKDTPYGDVSVSIKGNLIEDAVLVAGKYSDYGTELTVAKKYTAVAGQKLEDVAFTLAETVPNSLQGNRETGFLLPEGITIESVVISESEGLEKGQKPTVTIVQEKGKNTNEFRVSSIKGEPDANISLTFKATLNIPSDFNQDLILLVDGASIEEEKEIILAKIEVPVGIVVVPARVKVGLAKQTGGKITLIETKEENIGKGKIFFALEESTMRYTKAPQVEVTQGNLRVDGGIEIVNGGFEVTIKEESTRPSTLVISGGEISVDRTVPDGNFYVKVGGPALSAFSSETLWNVLDQKHNDIDALIEADFIIVGELIEEEVKNTASFVIGEMTYTINNQEKAMDAAPYLAEEGRTMLPVRYVADALGINPSNIIWDGDNKTVTIISDKVVQVKLGSKEMIIDKVTIPMSTEPELKNNRVFLPVAEVARALGAEIDWDNTTKTATFIK